ncbi:tyrosine-type recombinase/integrase [Chloroflexota bacterium]
MRGHIKKRYKNSNSWSIIIELPRGEDGKRKQQWITVKGTKKDAERELNSALARLGSGSYVKPAKLTVRGYLEQWLADYAAINVRPRTYERYQEIVRAHLIPAFGSIPLTGLQPHHVQSYYSKALVSGRRDGRGGLSARTVHHHHRVLFEALKYAIKHDMLIRNICESVDPPRPEYRQMSATDAQGVNKILEAVKDTLYYPLFYTAIYTGLRRSELLALSWKNVDLDFATLAVTETIHQLKSGELVFNPPKSNRGKRSVALSPSLAIMLREHKAKQTAFRERLGVKSHDNDLVFSNLDGAPLQPDIITRKFRRVAHSVGLPKLRFHDLRHTHATLMLQQGINVKVISERLGHSSIAITLDTYSHVLPGMQEAAAQRFEEGLKVCSSEQSEVVL